MKKITKLLLTLIFTALSQFGFNQNAMDFDGLNDFVTAPNASALISGSTNFSMSFWVFPTHVFPSGAQNYDGYAGIRNNSNADFYVLQLNNTTIEARFRNSGGTNYDILATGFIINTWNHMVFVYNGTQIKFYINGVLAGTTSATGTITNNTAALFMGNTPYFSTNFVLDGKLDHLALWDISLDSTQVVDLFNNTCDYDVTDTNLLLSYEYNQGIAGGTNTAITSITASKGGINGVMSNIALTGASSNFATGIAASSRSSFFDTACNSYVYKTNTYTSSGAYHDTLVNAAGCDSIVTLNLTIGNSVTTDIQMQCDSFMWINGITYTANNSTAKDTLTTIGGCDSIITLNLTLTNTTSTIDLRNACDSLIWINGITYTSNNSTAKDTVTSVGGCDSVVTLNLTILNSSSSIDVQSACNSYTWINGTTYTANNTTAQFTLTNTVGCDSVITLNLTILNTFGTDVQSHCSSYTWSNGVTYTSSNTSAKDTIPNAAGCDSIITLNLTILNTFGTDIQSHCDSYTWSNGVTYTSSNTVAKDTIPNAAGCDSIITLNLTINNTTSSVDVITACNSFVWINGVTYTSNNSTAKDTLTNAAGCDSVITLNITILSSINTTDIQFACDSYTWINGVTYTSSNSSAKDTLTTSNGCDSIINLNLTIRTSSSFTDVHSACDSFTWINGTTYIASNSTATDTLTNAMGCDSIITLNLTIHNSTSSVDIQSECDGYTWRNGVKYTASNFTASVTLVNAAGCDSIITLNLTIRNSTNSIDVHSACDSFTWANNGTTYTTSNTTAKDTLTNSIGCDSIITLNLTITNSSNSIDVQSACSSFIWINGVSYTANNFSAKDTMTSAAGCDSIVTLNLTINRIDTSVTKSSATVLKATDSTCTFQWFDCDRNMIVSGATSRSYAPTSTGNYAVILSKGGCTDTSSCHQMVVSTIGINEHSLEGVTLFPNPFSEVVTLAFPETISGTVTIMNLNGQIIRIIEIDNKRNLQIALTDEPNGMYIIKIKSLDATKNFRIMKN